MFEDDHWGSKGPRFYVGIKAPRVYGVRPMEGGLCLILD